MGNIIHTLLKARRNLRQLPREETADVAVSNLQQKCLGSIYNWRLGNITEESTFLASSNGRERRAALGIFVLVLLLEMTISPTSNGRERTAAT